MNPILMFFVVLAAIPVTYGVLSLLSLAATGVWTFFASIGSNPDCFLVAALVLSALVALCTIHVWLKLDAPYNLSAWADELDSALGERLEYAATAIAVGLSLLEGYMFFELPAAPSQPGLGVFVVFAGMALGAMAVARLGYEFIASIQAEIQYRRYQAQRTKR